MLAEAQSRAEQEFVCGVVAQRRRSQRVLEVAPHPVEETVRQLLRIRRFRLPLPCERAHPRIAIRRQRKQHPAFPVGQHVLDDGIRSRMPFITHQVGYGVGADRRHFAVHARRFRRIQRQLQHEQIATVGRLQHHFVGNGLALRRDARCGPQRRAVVAAPGFAIETRQHRAAPIHLVARRRGAREAHAHRRPVVHQHVLPVERRHAIAQAHLRDRIVWQPPHRRGQAREQPETGQCQW